MSDPKPSKRCEPDCACGRHKQYRWVGLTVADRFWSKVSRGGPNDCWSWNGAVTSSGYGDFWNGARMQKAHRFSLEMQTGPIPEGMQVDHRCFNRACVNPAHLRAVTQKQNIENHQGPKKNSTSGVRGVYRKPNGRWCAEVRHNGKRIHVGYFAEIDEAAAAVAAVRCSLHTHNDADRSA